MQLSVGIIEGREALDVELNGDYLDAAGQRVAAGVYRFESEIVLLPAGPKSFFTLSDVTIGIGFHWERRESQAFRGGLRIIRRHGLTVINDVELEDYVTSVISSEMSAFSSDELLKAHAVISRSWLWYPKATPHNSGSGHATYEAPEEITRWYGREAHTDFDVCADDHCQRYQGITKALSPSVVQAVRATAGEMLTFQGNVCDARFYKCCGGLTEDYSVAWDDRNVPYLVSVYDGEGNRPEESAEDWILTRPAAYCNTADSHLLSQILPAFDQETRDFYRWQVEYDGKELGDIVQSRLGLNLGEILDLRALARGASGRIFRLQIVGRLGSMTIGKELEIRRVLSRSHLYSSAFIVERNDGRFILKGAGWGHGVGLCQIGAAVMASRGIGYREILRHYYPGTELRQGNGN